MQGVVAPYSRPKKLNPAQITAQDSIDMACEIVSPPVRPRTPVLLYTYGSVTQP